MMSCHHPIYFTQLNTSNGICGTCHSIVSMVFTTPHAQRERGKVIGVSVHICRYICLWTKTIFESIDSPFQTFVVGLLDEFID